AWFDSTQNQDEIATPCQLGDVAPVVSPKTWKRLPLVVRGAVPAWGGSGSSFRFQSVRAVFPHTAYR
ncbi:MAG: hypothetical protein ACTHQQ_23630, partial [Solirubrobacteraceae bacterium]